MKLSTTEILQVIAEQSAHWTSQGFHGADLYDRLASDPAIPENLPPAVVAALLDVLPESLRERRKRGAGPGFVRPGQNSVLYPRAVFFGDFMKGRFVARPTIAAE